eukprot:GHVH01006933.1.p1 GENE.GHVH01006933.1~~GHVH01006933.1.p1  ORF type:complete len:139 (+),score=14.58 GHVH01006933.1:26-442(+)
MFGQEQAAEKSAEILAKRPWKASIGYFRKVYIQNGAFGKVVTDCCVGKDYEVMGLLFGHVTSNAFVITDSFCLPVEGTETRVNAGEEAEIFSIQYCTAFKRSDQLIGWYHSHPGYGPWLSGIDVATQEAQQRVNDPCK